jgi:hypothetical protein
MNSPIDSDPYSTIPSLTDGDSGWKNKILVALGVFGLAFVLVAVIVLAQILIEEPTLNV